MDMYRNIHMNTPLVRLLSLKIVMLKLKNILTVHRFYRNKYQCSITSHHLKDNQDEDITPSLKISVKGFLKSSEKPDPNCSSNAAWPTYKVMHVNVIGADINPYQKNK